MTREWRSRTFERSTAPRSTRRRRSSTRHLLAAAAIVGAATAALAGCGSSSSNSAGSSGGSSGGCNAQIGILSAFTGEDANAYGLNGAAAARYAYSVWHKSHPHCTVSFVRFDSQAEPSQAAPLTRQAVTNPKIVAMLGPTFSQVTQAVMPTINSGGLPAISADSTAPQMTQQGWKFFHRSVVNNTQEAPREAYFMTHVLHLKRIAVLDDTETYGKALANIFAAAAKKDGATIVDRESLNPSSSDYSTTIVRVKGDNADGIFFGGLDPTGAPFVKQLRASGSTVVFMGGSGLQTARYLSVGGTATEGSYVGSAGEDPTLTATGRRWLAGWKKMFHKGTDLYSVEWYNATMMFLDAIGSGATTRDAINAWIGSHSITGALGTPLKFSAAGDVTGATIYVYKVVNGQFKFVREIKAIP